MSSGFYGPDGCYVNYGHTSISCFGETYYFKRLAGWRGRAARRRVQSEEQSASEKSKLNGVEKKKRKKKSFFSSIQYYGERWWNVTMLSYYVYTRIECRVCS